MFFLNYFGWAWLNYLIFVIKLIATTIPFYAAAFFLAPYLPKTGVGLTAALLLVTLVFGYFTMVLSTDDEDDAPKSQKLHKISKVVFGLIYLLGLAYFLKLDHPTQRLFGLFTLPLMIIAARTFFNIQIKKSDD